MRKYAYSFIPDDYKYKVHSKLMANLRASVAGKLVLFESVVTAVKITGNEIEPDSFQAEEEILPRYPYFILDFRYVKRRRGLSDERIFLSPICLHGESTFCILSEMSEYKVMVEEG